MFPTFINNYVKEIRECKGLKLDYVSSNDNPADIASRGSKISELKNNKLWWSRPKCSILTKIKWPPIKTLKFRNSIKMP